MHARRVRPRDGSMLAMIRWRQSANSANPPRYSQRVTAVDRDPCPEEHACAADATVSSATLEARSLCGPPPHEQRRQRRARGGSSRPVCPSPGTARWGRAAGWYSTPIQSAETTASPTRPRGAKAHSGTPSAATPRTSEHDERPQHVELLFDRQAPRVPQRRRGAEERPVVVTGQDRTASWRRSRGSRARRRGSGAELVGRARRPRRRPRHGEHRARATPGADAGPGGPRTPAEADRPWPSLPAAAT